jgi:hypothetical protein
MSSSTATMRGNRLPSILVRTSPLASKRALRLISLPAWLPVTLIVTRGSKSAHFAISNVSVQHPSDVTRPSLRCLARWPSQSGARRRPSDTDVESNTRKHFDILACR